MEATGALLVSRGSEDAERLPVQVLETWADKWTQGAPMLQGISLKKRGREREWLTWGDQAASVSEAQKLYFSKGTFIPCLIHRGKWKMQGHTVSPNIPAVLPLSKPGFFLQTFTTNDVVYIIFWPWRPVNILWPSFDKGRSTRKFIFPQSVFSLYF